MGRRVHHNTWILRHFYMNYYIYDKNQENNSYVLIRISGAELTALCNYVNTVIIILYI